MKASPAFSGSLALVGLLWELFLPMAKGVFGLAPAQLSFFCFIYGKCRNSFNSSVETIL